MNTTTDITSTDKSSNGNTTGSPASHLISAGDGERIWIVGDSVWIKASAETTGGSLTQVEIQATPGAGPPPHIHRNEDEALYVLEGEFEFVLGEEIRTGGPGTFAFVPKGAVHRFSCIGDRPGRVLVTFTPGGMDGFFREAGRPAADDGPAPPVDEAEISRTGVAAGTYGMEIVSWEK